MSHRFLGYVTLLCIALFIFLVIYAQISERGKYCVRIAYADDIGNLKLENPVNINGIEVGTVKNIGRFNEKARVELKLLSGLEIKKDYKIINKDVSLTGDRSLTLFPGVSSDVFPVDSPLYITFSPGIAEGISKAESLEDLVKELRAIVYDYSRVDSDNDTLFTTKIKESLRFINKSTEKLEILVKENEGKVNELVDKAGEFTGNIRTTSARLLPQADKTVRMVDTLSKQASVMLDDLLPAIEQLDSLITMLEKANNPLMGAINNSEGYDKIGKAIIKLRSLIQVMGEDGIGLDIDVF
jgi:ABC-type transporter Mla subunit MlaD